MYLYQTLITERLNIMVYNFLLSAFFLLAWSNLHARDLTFEFNVILEESKPLSRVEKTILSAFDYYLVPGILSESFTWEDRRSYVNFAFVTKNYFAPQKKALNANGFLVEILPASSLSLDETKRNIQSALSKSFARRRKAVFITHSLGGIALLEEVISGEDQQTSVAGIIFLQTPFSGAPVADVYLANPYDVERFIGPVLPFFNTNAETIRLLSAKTRKEFLSERSVEIARLLKSVPVITAGGAVNGFKSLFSPSAALIQKGCISFFSKCVTGKLYAGPYDESDGMVPFQSSKLKNADFVRLEKADHGELVVNIPYNDFNRKKVTEALLKLLLEKMRGSTPKSLSHSLEATHR